MSEFEWKVGYRVLARNDGEVSPNRKNWNVGKINSQAIVTEIQLITYANRNDLPGVVIEIK